MRTVNITGPRSRFYLLILFILLLIGCYENQNNNKFNVLIVTFDTTRADHIASYGNLSALTPNIDKLAKDGVLYEKALTPIPITLPSHSSIMTGKVPFTHGVRDNGLFKLGEEQLTLAEILKKNKYQTAASIGSFPLSSQFGIDQGFEYFNEHITQKYEDINGDRTLPKERLFFDERNSAQVNQAIMPWIEKNYKSPFFAWVHYFDPHHPHEPPSPYNQTFNHDLYQGEIAFADESFGKLVEQLKKLKVYDNTLIVFTSDHGEGNGEHNESTHSLLIYNSTQHIPLIIKYPNQLHAGNRVEKWVGTVDILPTVLHALKIDVPDDIQGINLPVDNANIEGHEYYLETLSPKFSRGWGEQRGLIKDNYKYIYGPQKELYNLDNDPNELNNIIENETDIAKNMQQRLQEYIDEYQIPNLNSSAAINEETLNILRGLGYVQSSGQAVESIDEKLNDSGDPPQLHIDTINIYSQAKNMLFEGNYIEGSRFLNSLLLSDPNNLAYLELKIQVDIKLGNLIAAKSTLEQLPKNKYGSLSESTRLSLLANIHHFEGEIEEAIELFLKAEEIEQTSYGQYQLSKLYLKQNNLALQQKHLQNLLKIDNSDIQTINELAINLTKQNKLFEAEQIFDEATLLHPYHPLSFYNYGTFLFSINDFEAALILFRRAINLNPNYLKSHYAVIETLIIMNKYSEARLALEQLKLIAPNSQQFKAAEKLVLNK